jgi:hypothetical protein
MASPRRDATTVRSRTRERGDDQWLRYRGPAARSLQNAIWLREAKLNSNHKTRWRWPDRRNTPCAGCAEADGNARAELDIGNGSFPIPDVRARVCVISELASTRVATVSVT